MILNFKKCAQSALATWIERGIISNLNIIICKDSVTSCKHYTLLLIQSKCMEEWEKVEGMGPGSVKGFGGGGRILENLLKYMANQAQ